MYEKNLKFHNNGITYQLNLRSIYTIIEGESSSGKTMLCTNLRRFITRSQYPPQPELVEDWVKQTEILSPATRDEVVLTTICHPTPKVIVMDAADLLYARLGKWLATKIEENTQHWYILIGRELFWAPCEQFSKAELMFNTTTKTFTLDHEGDHTCIHDKILEVDADSAFIPNAEFSD